MMMWEGEGEKTTSTVKPDGPTADAPERQSIVSNCSHHPSQPLDLYCRQCEELVCRDCILFGKKHVNHPYDKVEVVTKDCRREVQQELASLLQKQPAIARAVADVHTAQQAIKESRGVISSRISESYNRVISTVEEKRDTQLRQFQSEADAKLKEMEAHKVTLTSILSQMNAVQSLVERGVEGLGDVEFMVRKKGMVFKINQMLHHISSLPSPPEASLHAHVIGSRSVEAVGLACEQHLRPYRVVVPSLCAGTVFRGNRHIQVGVATITSILLKDSEGHPCPLRQCVTMELCSPRFGKRVIPEVVCQSPTCYEAHYTPTLGTRGHCQLIVKVNGHMIGSGPIKIFIECPPQQLGEPVHIINSIPRPLCLKIFKEQMFCNTKSAGIFIIDLNNTSVPPTSAIFSRASEDSELAIDEQLGIMYVGDPSNNMLHKFKLSGQLLASSGQKGSAPGKFNRVNGLCVSKDGTVYVCDSKNHRIQVFDKNLKFLRCFGSHGTGPGQFNWPDNIDFDASGHLYATDHYNHRVQCLSADGDPIRCIGREGSGPGELIHPNILKVAGSHIFVTDENGVSVFTTGGQFISRFAALSSVYNINGLAIDEDGFVYVSDFSQHRIVVF